VTVSAGQSCVFVAGSEVNGNTTINGGSFTTAGTVTGNVTENAGSLEAAAAGEQACGAKGCPSAFHLPVPFIS